MSIHSEGLVELINSMIENHETVCDIPEEEQVWLDETDGQLKPYRWKKFDYNFHSNSPDLIHVSYFELLRKIGINSFEDAKFHNLSKKKKGK